MIPTFLQRFLNGSFVNIFLCAEILIEGNYAFEEILNSTSHGIAFLFSCLGCIILMSEAMADSHGKEKFVGEGPRFWACAIYSFSLMFLFLSSSLYHSFFMLPTASRVLQILDHVGIYMLIAGMIQMLFFVCDNNNNTFVNY